MDATLLNNIRFGLLFYIILLCSVCIHEWAHAFTADKLGDPLPRAQGRVTLNPLAHIDFLGTVIFPCLMIFGPILLGWNTGFILIGWGKPVEISLPNRKTRVRDDLLITIAGPLSNLAICLICALLVPIIFKIDANALSLIQAAILMNAALFVFNLLPIPPLDGGHFLKHGLRMTEETYLNMSRWGFFILLILINIPFFRMLLNTAIQKVVGIFNSLALSLFW
jgi:Zn-dependent protease